MNESPEREEAAAADAFTVVAAPAAAAAPPEEEGAAAAAGMGLPREKKGLQQTTEKSKENENKNASTKKGKEIVSKGTKPDNTETKKERKKENLTDPRL